VPPQRTPQCVAKASAGDDRPKQRSFAGTKRKTAYDD